MRAAILPLLATHTRNMRAIHAAAPASQASAWSHALILRWPVSCVASESTTRNQTLSSSPAANRWTPSLTAKPHASVTAKTASTTNPQASSPT